MAAAGVCFDRLDCHHNAEPYFLAAFFLEAAFFFEADFFFEAAFFLAGAAVTSGVFFGSLNSRRAASSVASAFDTSSAAASGLLVSSVSAWTLSFNAAPRISPKEAPGHPVGHRDFFFLHFS